MKKNERSVLLVVIAIGISSIVVQLITIREFLTHFHGNEFVISLILFTDGIPVFSNQNQSIAEETIHFPLAQQDNPQNVLLISGEGGTL